MSFARQIGKGVPAPVWVGTLKCVQRFMHSNASADPAVLLGPVSGVCMMSELDEWELDLLDILTYRCSVTGQQRRPNADGRYQAVCLSLF